MAGIGTLFATILLLAGTAGDSAAAGKKKVGAIFFGQVKVGNFEPTGYTAFTRMVENAGAIIPH